MANRIAASMSLAAFALSIVAGLQAQNTFATVLSNALLAMVVSLGVGLVVGTMAQKMLDENLAGTDAVAKNPANSQAQAEPGDR